MVSPSFYCHLFSSFWMKDLGMCAYLSTRRWCWTTLVSFADSHLKLPGISSIFNHVYISVFSEGDTCWIWGEKYWAHWHEVLLYIIHIVVGEKFRTGNFWSIELQLLHPEFVPSSSWASGHWNNLKTHLSNNIRN